MLSNFTAGSQYKKKLNGWLSYAFARFVHWALAQAVVTAPATILVTRTTADEFYSFIYFLYSEVFVIVSLTLFLPICLEQFARDNGYLLPDKIVSCSAASSPSPRPPITTADGDALAEAARCVVKIGWVWIDSASFRYVRSPALSVCVCDLCFFCVLSLYVYSISVALQALTVISMGGIADHREFSYMLAKISQKL